MRRSYVLWKLKMIKFLSSISTISVGVFIILNPKFTARGAITDLSYMHLNIFIGCIFIVIGLILLRKTK